MTLCRVLKVNRSTYYKHFSAQPAPRTIENQEIRSRILEVYSASQKRLGAAKIKVVLLRDYGINISVGRVYRLMKGMRLPKMSTRKPRIHTAQEAQTRCINHLDQKFNPPAPNQIWVSDITYIRIAGGFAYLCAVMDLFSRKIIAFRVHHKMDSSFVMQTLRQALDLRKPSNAVLFHSDRGSQYTCLRFRKFCDENQITQSFSKKGYPWDNSVMEAFFKYAKQEEFSRRSFASIAEVKMAAFKYIEGFYNSRRPHSANQMMTPNEREAKFHQNT